MNDIRSAPAIVVMGVAGCGKTVMGEVLAEALGAVFIEGDRLHPPKNVARMARGEPLTDA
ncbi:MAG: gluconokinase, partial [Mesorhizobium sp.]